VRRDRVAAAVTAAAHRVRRPPNWGAGRSGGPRAQAVARLWVSHSASARASGTTGLGAFGSGMSRAARPQRRALPGGRRSPASSRESLVEVADLDAERPGNPAQAKGCHTTDALLVPVRLLAGDADHRGQLLLGHTHKDAPVAHPSAHVAVDILRPRLSCRPLSRAHAPPVVSFSRPPWQWRHGQHLSSPSIASTPSSQGNLDPLVAARHQRPRAGRCSADSSSGGLRHLLHP